MSIIISSGEHPEVGVDEAFTFDTADDIGDVSQFSYFGKRFESLFAMANKSERQYKHLMVCLNSFLLVLTCEKHFSAISTLLSNQHRTSRE